MNKLKVITGIAAFCLMLNGCYYDNEEELYAGSGNCDTSVVDYATDIKPIFATNCAISGCHVPGPGRKDLSNDQGIKDIADNGELKDRVVVRKDMPPSGPLSSCNVKLIQAWIDNGAPVN